MTGKILGKTKIAPQISPNKTTEGLIGGILLSSVLSAFLGYFLLPPQSLWLNVGFGFLISLLGFIGDLTMSYIKRKFEVKDAGTLIPGHGGLLDRIDSLLFVLPTFYYICLILYK